LHSENNENVGKCAVVL